MLIDIDKIVVNDRIRHDYGDLEELAEDIRTNTLLNPPVVNTKNPDGTYTLIAGERRLRAMRDVLGYTQVDVNVVPAEDDEHALLMEISENECRKEFTKTERLDYARRLARIEAAKSQQGKRNDLAQDVVQSERNRSANAVAQALGTNRETIRQEQYISDNRDLLDPADFAEWDEGKLSTNKAFQRIKAAMAQAERERDEARKDAEAVSELYGKVIVQRDQAESERKRVERELRKASITQTNLEMEAESLKQQLSQRPEPEVIEREVEVVREVVPEEVKRRIESLEYSNQLNEKDNATLRRQLEETRKKLDRAKVLLEEKGYEDNASWDISTLTSATNQYLRRYGGKLWAFDQFYRVDEVTQQEFVKAITNLAAFAQGIVQYISDANKLEA